VAIRLAMHYHLRQVMHQSIKFQLKRSMRRWVMDDSTQFPNPIQRPQWDSSSPRWGHDSPDC